MHLQGANSEADSSSEHTFVDARLLVASELDRREQEKRDSACLSLAIRVYLDPSSVCQQHVSTDRSDLAMGHRFGFVKATCWVRR